MLKVFLVEDSSPLRQRIIAMVESIEGVELGGVTEESQAALDGIKATHAVIVDLRLTGDSGLEVIAGIQRERLPVVTIVLTNYSDAAFRNACRSAGADFFFDKTTEYELARATIERLARARLTNANAI
ncbi:response regulator receiver protein [Caballeronia terrestris]|jgi:DNA-binding NarL/FixJ family response regulator|uniref:Response regulator receiver protein n=2 Tax=Caballeronia TaxID=1827195 RepID=A0A158KV19_9BURK|nr:MULTISPECIES: response regulator [Caballeronia]SAL61831.1 response regulator receiver protein [Caballeronia humi]SAL84589.1 response regulator receiver protein [Caballeronia terrestris]